jgi:uncharacterized protein (DUF1501 family)
MNRRNFVKRISLASLGAPFIVKGMAMEAVTKDLFNVPKTLGDRVLVIIRLNGGNDGLATLFPVDQYSQLVTQRQNILIPQSNLLTLTSDNALHPAMTGMRNLFNDNKLGIIQNVGYPEQNRSHFRSMDIWTSGAMALSETRGWLGKFLDGTHDTFPEGYPNDDYPDPFAISMGYEVTATCQGIRANYSHSVVNPFENVNLPNPGAGNDGTYYGSHMEYLQMIIDQTNAYGGQIRDAANAGNNLSSLYDNNNPLAKQLKNVARMISGGLKTKIYVLDVGGFDTHDSQVQQGAVTLGTHTNLLKRVSDAVYAFQDDLRLLGLEQRVLGMTFSEFGRQIASNASLGTDHGDAAPLFLFGSCVRSGIYGPNPIIPNTVVNQAGLPMQVDFRDIYASVLRDWFQADEQEIQSLFEHEVVFHNIVGECNLNVEATNQREKVCMIYPNPCVENVTLKLETGDEEVGITIVDLNGRIVANIYEGHLSPAVHHIEMNIMKLPRGSYRVQIQRNTGTSSLQLLKIR